MTNRTARLVTRRLPRTKSYSPAGARPRARVAGYAALAGLTIWYARRGYDLQLDVARLGAVFGAAILAVLASRVAASGATVAGVAIHVAVALAFIALAVAILRQPWRTARALVPASAPAQTDSLPG